MQSWGVQALRPAAWVSTERGEGMTFGGKPKTRSTQRGLTGIGDGCAQKRGKLRLVGLGMANYVWALPTAPLCPHWGWGRALG